MKCSKCQHEVLNAVVILRRALNPYLKSGAISVFDRDLIRVFFARIEEQMASKEEEHEPRLPDRSD